MIHRRLTTAEAAARLGVKPATLYAYVSRGVLSRVRTPAGQHVRPAGGRPPGPIRPPPVGSCRRRPAAAGAARCADGRLDRDRRRGPAATRPATRSSSPSSRLIDGGRLYYRGLDAVELSRARTFEEVADWLWTGRWPTDEVGLGGAAGGGHGGGSRSCGRSGR